MAPLANVLNKGNKLLFHNVRPMYVTSLRLHLVAELYLQGLPTLPVSSWKGFNECSWMFWGQQASQVDISNNMLNKRC